MQWDGDHIGVPSEWRNGRMDEAAPRQEQQELGDVVDRCVDEPDLLARRCPAWAGRLGHFCGNSVVA